MLGDVDLLAYFTDSFTNSLSKIIQAVTCLVVVAQASIWVALVMIVVCIINFAILKLINKLYSRAKGRQHAARGEVYESLNRILSSKEVINEFDANNEYEKKISRIMC